MWFKSLAAAVLAACAACAGVDVWAQAAPDPTVAELVAKNASARGGVEAWRQLQTMVWTGYVESSAQPGVKLPFMLEQQRPQKTRFELMAEGQKSVRVFSDSDGWKMRASSGGKPELQAYSADELKFAQGAQVIDGPLMDFAARGSSMALIGRDELDGHKAYVLEAKTPEGEAHRVWLDAQTFLELRLDRSFHNSVGRQVLSSLLYRDYRPFEGLQIAVVVETGTPSDKAGEKAFNRLVIERVALNPPLDANTFAKPALPASRHSGGVVVDTRAAATSAPGKAPRPASMQ